MNRPGPLVVGLLSALLFGLATPASKWLLSGISPTGLAGLLYLGAAAATAYPALRPGRLPFWKASARNRWRLIGAVVFGGILGPALLLLGLQQASAGSVSLWLNLELVATAILGVAFFRDHLGPYGWAAAAAVLMGAVILSLGGPIAGIVPALLVAGACACWGLDNHWTALIDGLHPSQSTFWKGAIGGTTNLLLAVTFQPFTLSAGPVALALLVGVLSYGASIVLYIHAAQALGATRAQLVFATAPVWGLGGSILALSEPLEWRQGAAMVLMAAGVALMYREKHEHEHRHETMEHAHSHRHDDGHHNHVHPGLPPATRHSHPHVHQAMTHRHPHWPDLHHRHGH